MLDAIKPDPVAPVHPLDLADMGGQPGEPITIASRRGEVVSYARADDSSPRGSVFVPFCYYEAAINKLTNAALDPYAQIPEFKYCAIRVSPGRTLAELSSYDGGKALAFHTSTYNALQFLHRTSRVTTNLPTQRWVRFAHENRSGFGTLDEDTIRVYTGDMFATPTATDQHLPLASVKLLMPTQPGKVIALWNNFVALGKKLGLSAPPEPLYFLKAPNSFANPGDIICKPRAEGKVVFEGELGIVIGKTATAVSESDAMAHVFGYTCANDVTMADILNRDPTFPQWVRAKGFDSFCPMGPTIATGLDPSTLVVKTTLNGDVRQNYPISDMRFTVAQLVSLISTDMTLFPGDVILCGTSLGVGSMKPGSDVEIGISGIGALQNRFE